jgi:bifunctional non-homologous end joining protein LigD
MPLMRRRSPFWHPDWLFEIKWDGFRSLAKIERGKCTLISSSGNEFKSFAELSAALRGELRAGSAALDGDD